MKKKKRILMKSIYNDFFFKLKKEWQRGVVLF